MKHLSSTHLTYASKQNFSFDMHAAMLRCRSSDSDDTGCRTYANQFGRRVPEYQRREQLMRAAYDAFKHAVPEINENIARVAELEQSRNSLGKCAAFDYAAKLRGAKDHIRRN